MLAVADDSALHLLEFVDRRALPNELSRLQLQAGCALGIGRSVVSAQLKAELTQYFNKTLPRFEVPVIQHGTAFERTVWAASCDIPMGQMRWRLCFHATELYLQTGRWRAIAAGCGASGGCLRLRRHNLYQTACEVQNWILPSIDTLKPMHS